VGLQSPQQKLPVACYNVTGEGDTDGMGVQAGPWKRRSCLEKKELKEERLTLGFAGLAGVEGGPR